MGDGLEQRAADQEPLAVEFTLKGLDAADGSGRLGRA
ncbi:unannotated protein [freshwater metagenome]|uniref:Unannotated protein n=1 Tax=freshwater metagenome TaxID=449393 RepID=A0A6J5YFH3_9ZZZZ